MTVEDDLLQRITQCQENIVDTRKELVIFQHQLITLQKQVNHITQVLQERGLT